MNRFSNEKISFDLESENTFIFINSLSQVPLSILKHSFFGIEILNKR